MELVLIAVALAGVAIGIAWALQRGQKPEAPVRTGYAIPAQLDRADLARPAVPWLVVVFTSATCDACASVWDTDRPLVSDAMAVQAVEYVTDRELHDRYSLEAVPTTLIVAPELGSTQWGARVGEYG